MFQRALSPLPGSGGGATKVKSGDYFTGGAWSGYGMSSIGAPVGTYYTATFDVSGVNSVELRYLMNVADDFASRGRLGYSLDGTDTLLTNSTTAQTINIDLTSVSEFSLFSTVVDTSIYGNSMICAMKFS